MPLLVSAPSRVPCAGGSTILPFWSKEVHRFLEAHPEALAENKLRPSSFLRAYRWTALLSRFLVVPFVQLPFMADELHLFAEALYQSHNDATGSEILARLVAGSPVSCDGVRGLAPIAVVLNLCSAALAMLSVGAALYLTYEPLPEPQPQPLPEPAPGPSFVCCDEPCEYRCFYGGSCLPAGTHFPNPKRWCDCTDTGYGGAECHVPDQPDDIDHYADDYVDDLSWINVENTQDAQDASVFVAVLSVWAAATGVILLVTTCALLTCCPSRVQQTRLNPQIQISHPRSRLYQS